MRGKMVGLFAVVLIALVVAGLAYAHWSETLYINGSVSTGELDVAIISATCNDVGIDPNKDKNVGSCTATLYDLDGDGDYDKVEVILDNLYPCYTCTLTVVIKNVGTIPAKDVYWDFTVISDPNGLAAYLDVTYTGIPVGQLDPGDEATLTGTIHVRQGAPEKATLTFEGYIVFEQWM